MAHFTHTSWQLLTENKAYPEIIPSPGYSVGKKQERGYYDFFSDDFFFALKFSISTSTENAMAK